jgi:hypothetical protein
MADPIYGKAPKIKGKTVFKKKVSDKSEGKVYKTVEKVTPAGEKISIKTTKYKSPTANGTKSITKITGNTKNMTGSGISNAATKTYVKKKRS